LETVCFTALIFTEYVMTLTEVYSLNNLLLLVAHNAFSNDFG